MHTNLTYVAVMLGMMVFQKAHAHTFLSNIAVGDTEEPVGKYIQKYLGYKLFPVNDVTTKNMRCRNAEGIDPKAATFPVKAGTEFSVVWHHYNNSITDNMVSPSHRGPCTIYMAQQKPNPDDNQWFKIYELGFDKTANLWCSDILRNAHGRLNFTLPMDIVDGNYLLRTELIALHKAAFFNGTQFYPNCVQLSISGSKNKFLDPPPHYVSFPGAYGPEDKGILYDVKQDKGQNYVIPGPEVYPPVTK
ncbi:hypothetical protein H4R26_004781 [Coemansia thaxteri]|uniref:AA9 family lytic polysaccharide monooxygenase n=1 Tax=Coemansia thaxteri TaxID=2663907 RepID=A0A9W8BE80_9FUNG|nr:hypothetical protein H4R26_004781 [Coemansia thaxteri]